MCRRSLNVPKLVRLLARHGKQLAARSPSFLLAVNRSAVSAEHGPHETGVLLRHWMRPATGPGYWRYILSLNSTVSDPTRPGPLPPGLLYLEGGVTKWRDASDTDTFIK